VDPDRESYFRITDPGGQLITDPRNDIIFKVNLTSQKRMLGNHSVEGLHHTTPEKKYLSTSNRNKCPLDCNTSCIPLQCGTIFSLSLSPVKSTVSLLVDSSPSDMDLKPFCLSSGGCPSPRITNLI
jgi:hypothetical protein